uniref:PID domain-containing protein n=1 Tax=Arion vulgaris TaxID=1028688 RepID=A0A0B6ZYJ2_9EUPU
MSDQKVRWIHPDAQLSSDAGVCYGVRYIGCLEIKESMKSLDFETRTAVARESISRVAEAAGLKTSAKKKKVDRRLGKMLGEAPHLQRSGSNVNLTITTESINLMIMESGEIIADHPLHVVSFASGGDMDTVDFVSYVAKDPEYGRACHVLECGGGLAEDVVSTIGQAFELRFKQYLKKQPKAVLLPDKHDKAGFEDERWGNSEEYYNDNPDAVPPDLGLVAEAAAPEIPPLPEYNPPSKAHDSRHERLMNEAAAGIQLHDNIEPLIVDLPPAPEPPSTSPLKASHKEGETDLRASRQNHCLNSMATF